MTLKQNFQPHLIKNIVNIIEGKDGFPLIEVDNQHAKALISVYGAQVLSYQLKSQNDKGEEHNKELLYVSAKAFFEVGKAIKGGIPICWPWFGKDAENPERQMHGFARNMLWKLEETAQLNSDDTHNKGATQIVLSLNNTDNTHALWPHNFQLILTIVIGRSLTLSLKTINTSIESFTITQALHSYFAINDISQVKLKGLGGTNYLNKVTGENQPKIQRGNLKINGEVDRIYIDAPSQATLIEKISDTEPEHEVSIQSSGSNTIVVWNPWIDISKKSDDLSDDAYQHFICVEIANAADDIIKIAPEESFTIDAKYTVL